MKKVILVFICCFQLNVFAKNDALKQAILALENNDFSTFKNGLKNRTKGLLDLEKDDLENAKKMFELLHAFKINNLFMQEMNSSDDSLKKILFEPNKKVPGFSQEKLIEDNHNNTVLHYIANNMQLDASNEVYLFWLKLVETIFKYTELPETLKKNNQQKTFYDVMKERNFKKPLNLFMHELNSETARYYKGLILTRGMFINTIDLLEMIKKTDPEVFNLIFTVTDSIAHDKEPLLHQIAKGEQKNIFQGEYEAQMVDTIIKDSPKLAYITNTDGKNIAHIIAEQVPTSLNANDYQSLIASLSKIDNGALFSQKDNNGQTPLAIAQKTQYTNIAQYIVAATKNNSSNSNQQQADASVLELALALGDIR